VIRDDGERTLLFDLDFAIQNAARATNEQTARRSLSAD